LSYDFDNNKDILTSAWVTRVKRNRYSAAVGQISRFTEHISSSYHIVDDRCALYTVSILARFRIVHDISGWMRGIESIPVVLAVFPKFPSSYSLDRFNQMRPRKTSSEASRLWLIITNKWNNVRLFNVLWNAVCENRKRWSAVAIQFQTRQADVRFAAVGRWSRLASVCRRSWPHIIHEGQGDFLFTCIFSFICLIIVDLICLLFTF